MFNRMIIYQEIQFSTELWLFRIDPTACESKFGECSVGDSAIWLFVMHQALEIAPETQSSTEFHIAWWVWLGWRSPQNTTSGYMDKLGMVAVAIGFTKTWRIAWKVSNWKRVVKEFSTGSVPYLQHPATVSFISTILSAVCIWRLWDASDTLESQDTNEPLPCFSIFFLSEQPLNLHRVWGLLDGSQCN